MTNHMGDSDYRLRTDEEVRREMEDYIAKVKELVQMKDVAEVANLLNRGKEKWFRAMMEEELLHGSER